MGALTLREDLLEALVLSRPLLVLRLQGLHLGCILRRASSEGHALADLPQPAHAHRKTAVLQLLTPAVSPLSTELMCIQTPFLRLLHVLLPF